MSITLQQLQGEIVEANPTLAGLELSGGESLSALGIDSLTVVAVLVSAAARHGLDLAQLPEEAPPPDLVSDLLLMLRSLPAVPAGAS
ncbi:MAG TPA: hypothetical protein VFZ91_10235 [Allosphingosinicella sp.]